MRKKIIIIIIHFANISLVEQLHLYRAGLPLSRDVILAVDFALGHVICKVTVSCKMQVFLSGSRGVKLVCVTVC